jgi:lysophospholipase L1-like esterase
MSFGKYNATVGDSLAEGYSNGKAGKRGATIQQVMEQLRAVPRGANVLMFAGTNDALGDPKRIADTVDKMIALARARNIKLTWVGPGKMNGSADGYTDKHLANVDKILADRLKGSGVTYISLRNDISVTPTPNNVHPTATTYNKLREFLNGKSQRHPSPKLQPMMA